MFIEKPKAIKCLREFLCYLSFYIRLLASYIMPTISTSAFLKIFSLFYLFVARFFS